MKTYPSKEIGKDVAIALYNSGWWIERPAKEVALFQLSVAELSLPFDEFHRCVEEALGRPVWTHEFATKDALIAEMLGNKLPPTMEEIVSLIPPDKRILLEVLA